MNRYIYHYCAASGPETMSGIAQLTFKIKSQDDLNKLKALVSTEEFNANCIISLSYLGKEDDE